MGKEEFLAALRSGLAGLPPEDAEERLAFCGEMIDDRMEAGFTEEEAVAAAGSVEDVVAQTLADIPLTKLVKSRVAPGGRRSFWRILLLVLGFPLWFPLLAAAGAVAFSLYVVLWSLVVCLWAVEASLWAGALAGLVLAAVYALRGAPATALLCLGGGLVCAGLSVFLFFACKSATAGMGRLTKRLGLRLKSLFLRKERTE